MGIALGHADSKLNSLSSIRLDAKSFNPLCLPSLETNLPLCAPSPVSYEIQGLLVRLLYTVHCSLIYETLHHSLEVQNYLEVIIS